MNLKKNWTESFAERQSEIDQALLQLRKHILKVKKEQELVLARNEEVRHNRFAVASLVRNAKKVFLKG